VKRRSDEEESSDSIFFGFLWAVFFTILGAFGGGLAGFAPAGAFFGLVAGFFMAGKRNGGRGVAGAVVAAVLIGVLVFVTSALRDYHKTYRKYEDRAIREM
jgi:hypothetical protein